MPQPPGNLTRQSAVAFAEAYTNFSFWNEELAGEEFRRIDVDTNGFVVNQTNTGYIIHVARSWSSYTCDGIIGHSGLPGEGYDYFINESLLAMTYTGLGLSARNATVHPRTSVEEILRNGSIVEQWNQTA